MCCSVGCGCGCGLGSSSGSAWGCGLSCRFCGFCFKEALGEAEAFAGCLLVAGELVGCDWSRWEPFPVAPFAFIAFEVGDFSGGCSNMLAASFSNRAELSGLAGSLSLSLSVNVVRGNETVVLIRFSYIVCVAVLLVMAEDG